MLAITFLILSIAAAPVFIPCPNAPPPPLEDAHMAGVMSVGTQTMKS